MTRHVGMVRFSCLRPWPGVRWHEIERMF